MRFFHKSLQRMFLGFLLRIRMRSFHGAIFTLAMGVVSAIVLLLCMDVNFSHGFVHPNHNVQNNVESARNSEVDNNNIDPTSAQEQEKEQEPEQEQVETENKKENIIKSVSIPPGILYPQESETREVKSLDGIWNFRLAPRLQAELGFAQEWFTKPLYQTGDVELMPVPSSYNDVTQSKDIRDHIGWVWYDRTFWLPKSWEMDKRIFLRFGSVHYQAIVYVNGEKVVDHSGGSLPFLVQLDNLKLNFRGENRITVAVSNVLSYETIPQGYVSNYSPGDDTSWFQFPDGYFTLSYEFDFFNYGGIHRSVFLYTTPTEYIDDIDVTPNLVRETGFIAYKIKIRNDEQIQNELRSGKVSVSLEDKDGQVVTSGESSTGELTVPKAKLWWPRTMVPDDKDAGYRYTFVVKLKDDSGNVVDVYRLKVGIRSIKWTEKEFLINEKPFYFRGYGRHEDFDVRGKGIDNVMLVKDHNLIKWTGGNSYRTSHYPYAEEIMELADKLGIAIIDEVPAVSTYGFSDTVLETHTNQMTELIQRDKNRACVVMWSVANEAKTSENGSQIYFKKVVDLTRKLDQRRRPITLVTASDVKSDLAVQYVDVIAVNRYYGWYTETGHLEIIAKSVVAEMQNWAKTYNKLVMMSEYGADTLVGIHRDPSTAFSEEYQVEFLREHFKAFDFLRRNKTGFIGEHIWNFADFQTAQGTNRASGNRKGIFTRDRQPKSAAHIVRHRYHLLAAEYDKYPLPNELKDTRPVFHGEL